MAYTEGESDQDTREAWARELKRRVAEIDRGDVKTYSFEEVMAELDRLSVGRVHELR